ncbi:hypothetical protein [Lentibacter sp.]|uniref:hypothetical protein n=1 Tax=Lentibacter sp. TaxID=2024994 RepID=UPI003F6A6DD6
MSEARRPVERRVQGRPSGQLFLPKDSYRARRAIDALRLWPVLGVVLFLLPVIWTGAAKSNVGAMGYLFAVWLVLIVGGALLTRRLGANTEAEPGLAPLPEPQDDTP